MPTKTIEAFGYTLNHRDVSLSELIKTKIHLLGIGCLLLLITNLIMVFLPILINASVSVIEKEEGISANLVFFDITFLSIYEIIAAIIVLIIFAAIMRTLSRMVIFDVGRRIERDVRARLFFHISALDDRFFLQKSVGNLMNHLTTDVTNIRMVSGFAALNLMNIAFVFCFTMPLLLRIDTVLAFVALLPFPLVIIATRGISKQMFLATSHYQKTLGELASHVQENLSGSHIVRLFHQQTSEGKRFFEVNRNTYQAGIKLARIRVVMQPLMRLIIGICIGLVLYVGGQAIIFGRISLGDFVEINARILQLSWPAMSVGFIMSMISSGKASLERINQLLRYTPAIFDGPKIMS